MSCSLMQVEKHWGTKILYLEGLGSRLYWLFCEFQQRAAHRHCVFSGCMVVFWFSSLLLSFSLPFPSFLASYSDMYTSGYIYICTVVGTRRHRCCCCSLCYSTYRTLVCDDIHFVSRGIFLHWQRIIICFVRNSLGF